VKDLLKQRWSQLQARERRILLVGALALILLGGYSLVWEPYVDSRARLERDVAEQRALLEWMERSAREVQALRGGRPAGGAASGQSLLALADGSARAQGLGSALQRVEPDGANGVRVWLEQAPFDDVLRWLDKLSSERGVRVSSFATERRAEQPGRVDVRIVLEGGA
jgi:general secretion pathway protein M